MPMQITPIACLSDNYAYLVVCPATRKAAIVDPSEAPPVTKVADAARAADPRLSIEHIWNTHHHPDHVGGNEAVKSHVGAKKIYGYQSDKGRIPGQTELLENGDAFALGDLKVRTIHIPGHTLGAVAYVVTAPGTDGKPDETAVFTGDTLFLAGCGRLFEGSPAQMRASLVALAGLPADTKIYCGHEYTESNLRFAKSVEPTNARIDALRAKVAEERGAGRPSVPWTMADDLGVNPFQRVDSKEIRATLGIADDADDATALGAIRKAKDNFK
jgi:hydroxyacylglutathione hydrolase